jgi:CheY-like chemotaxis protein
MLEEEAIALTVAEHPDVIVLDLLMPKRRGILSARV